MRHPALFVFCIISIALSAGAGRVFAAGEGIGISVEPFLSDLVFEEGETEKPFAVTLTNGSSAEMRLEATPVDFGSLDVSAGVAFLGASRDIEASYDRARWISIESESITIPPGGTVVLRGKLVNVPDLAPGGHYGAILFSMRASDPLAMGPASIAVDQRISALVFLIKRGGERYAMEFIGANHADDVFGRIRSSDITFRSAGNVHVVPRGRVDIIDPIGRVVAKGIVNENSSIVLPGTDRTISVRIRPILTSWVPGTYTHRTDYRYDGKDEYESRSESFLVLPPIFLASVAAILAAFGVGILIRVRRRGGLRTTTV